MKTPADEADPLLADHVTDCDGEFAPATTAEHVEIEPAKIGEGAQLTVTPETVAGAGVIVIDADADFAVSVTEVAVSVTVAGLGTLAGAV